MSEELQSKYNTLHGEHEALKQQMQQNQQGIESLLSQLEAYREQMNESLTMGLNMRTNLVFLKKHSTNLTNTNSSLQKQLEEANKRLADATNRIAELEARAVSG